MTTTDTASSGPDQKKRDNESSHPFPAEWGWYASTDGDDFFPFGPCSTREDAIAEAMEIAIGEDRPVVYVCRALQRRVDLATCFDLPSWLEMVGESLDDDGWGADEDGERHPLEEITDAQQDDLDASIKGAIRDWQRRHGLKLQSVWFAACDDREAISVEVTK